MKSFNSLKGGILTGTTFTVIPNLYWHDVVRTMLLACVGAIVSALVTFILQRFKPK